MPGSPGDKGLSVVAQAFLIAQDWGFRVIDKTPLLLRKWVYRSGALDVALEGERVVKRVGASLIKPLIRTDDESELQKAILDYVRNEARREVEYQRDSVGKLLLSHHIRLS
jgi:hypothetical protein